MRRAPSMRITLAGCDVAACLSLLLHARSTDFNSQRAGAKEHWRWQWVGDHRLQPAQQPAAGGVLAQCRPQEGCELWNPDEMCDSTLGACGHASARSKEKERVFGRSHLCAAAFRYQLMCASHMPLACGRMRRSLRRNLGVVAVGAERVSGDSAHGCRVKGLWCTLRRASVGPLELCRRALWAIFITRARKAAPVLGRRWSALVRVAFAPLVILHRGPLGSSWPSVGAPQLAAALHEAWRL